MLVVSSTQVSNMATVGIKIRCSGSGPAGRKSEFNMKVSFDGVHFSILLRICLFAFQLPNFPPLLFHVVVLKQNKQPKKTQANRQWLFFFVDVHVSLEL